MTDLLPTGMDWRGALLATILWALAFTGIGLLVRLSSKLGGTAGR
jgi:hypothetical protein